MDTYGKDFLKVKDCFVEAGMSGIAADQIFLEVLKKTLPQLAENFPGSMEGAVERPMLQDCMQNAFADLVQKAGNETLMQFGTKELGFSIIERFLDMTLQACDQQIIEPGFLATLVEDLVDSSTIMECEQIFAYLERQTATLLKPYITQRGKIIILRVCNQMLKRLSKSKDAQLCGRILSFLARFFPVTERSALNLQGVYNDSHYVVLEDIPAGSVDSNGEKINAALYRQFWGLQSIFQNPTQVLQSASAWTQTAANINRILSEFQRRPTVGNEKDNGKNKQSTITAPKKNIMAGAGHYLSSSQLFHLQLRDATFRKHFLLQCLILCQYCKTPGKNEKEPMKGKQLEELTSLEGTLFEALKKLPPSGNQFTEEVERILRREGHWVEWKKSGCPPFDKPKDPITLKRDRDFEEVRPKKLIRVNESGEASSMGVAELDRLWSQPTHLKSAERGRLCGLREFLQPVIDEMDPQAEIDEQYKMRNEKLYKWRAFRMLSKYSLQTLAKIHLSLPQITKLMGQDCSYDGSLKLNTQINPKEITKQDKLYGNLELIIADIFADEVPAGWQNPFEKLEDDEKEEEGGEKKGGASSQAAPPAASSPPPNAQQSMNAKSEKPAAV